MQRIKSFEINHNVLVPGFYISREDGDVVTYDLRTRKPNAGDYMSNAVMHSVEHMFATFARNSEVSDKIVYFGPMGCQTGFYFLFDGAQLSESEAVALVQQVFARGAAYDGEMPGKSAAECGNYRNLDVALARDCCRYYAGVIADWNAEKLVYPTGK